MGAPSQGPGTEIYDYVVVGSGAGGGPLAANLAEAGMSVLVLEAGDTAGNELLYPVPAFHALASEDEKVRWSYFVRHYDDDLQQARDSKFVAAHDGILYPRAATVGGCTAHHAMITIYPHNRDWDAIAEITGDRSWESTVMREYFERLERCQYRPRPWLLPRRRSLARLLARLPLPDTVVNRGRHGFDGWLPTSQPDPKLAVRDGQLLQIVIHAARESLADFLGRPLGPLEDFRSFLDPNDWRVQQRRLQGLWLVPMSTTRGRRSGARERLQATQRDQPELLVVRTGALVARVLFEGQVPTAVGVEYLDLSHAYRADPAATRAAPGTLRQVRARREVVLCGGAFNTPQLLKLSGVGPRGELESLGIDVVADRPGVGENLQDRYEIGVAAELGSDLALIRECSFQPPAPDGRPDPCYQAWEAGTGPYTTNGVIVAITRKSRPELADPDLFIFGLPAHFTGYYPGYSADLQCNRKSFTWAILKAHTRNTSGRVTLRSVDPRDMPDISFNYFNEETDKEGSDLAAMVAGIQFIRGVNRRAGAVVKQETTPGAAVASEEQISEFVRNEAWGHHASCSCRIGRADDPMAVVDSQLRVYGTRRLRVVDASVFPHIPGFFVATSVYMVAEKASDLILADAGRAPVPSRRPAMRRADSLRSKEGRSW
ncbi:GMC oxidoreductase [Parafrankia sp. EAN1pec]|uniref:GMC family oxidoreductase n=1 Tax=Parafrankia sp. (strain EAN1pec) TaxID=298653 RepID=UPI0000544363|nr:GMC oxidoreductase [Frankia sp. EAN1pec]